MTHRAFLGKEHPPNDVTLRQTLGPCFAHYAALRQVAKGFDTQWTFYKGWSEKFFDSSKTLFYMIPYEAAYRVRLTLRESEAAPLLGDEHLEDVHEMIRGAQTVGEGVLLDFFVEDAEAAVSCSRFIKALISLR